MSAAALSVDISALGAGFTNTIAVNTSGSAPGLNGNPSQPSPIDTVTARPVRVHAVTILTEPSARLTAIELPDSPATTLRPPYAADTDAERPETAPRAETAPDAADTVADVPDRAMVIDREPDAEDTEADEPATG
jgi:hypothetical protein